MLDTLMTEDMLWVIRLIVWIDQQGNNIRMDTMNKPTKQQIADAWKTVGNQPSWALRNMIKALSMCPMMNSLEDNKRLAAAKIAAKYPNPRYQ